LILHVSLGLLDFTFLIQPLAVGRWLAVFGVSLNYPLRFSAHAMAFSASGNSVRSLDLPIGGVYRSLQAAFTLFHRRFLNVPLP
jgi:hypothetical protein